MGGKGGQEKSMTRNETDHDMRPCNRLRRQMVTQVYPWGLAQQGYIGSTEPLLKTPESMLLIYCVTQELHVYVRSVRGYTRLRGREPANWESSRCSFDT